MGRPKGQGEAVKWLHAHVGHAGDDCLIWPFSRTRGYGMLGYLGAMHYAHRFMCELAHGSAPTPDHEAAHSCGRGHDACVHPKHLSWKTRAENRKDRELHQRKPKNFRYKLTEVDVVQIRRLEGKETNAAIAKRFGVARTTIRAIFAGDTWKYGYDPCGIKAKAALTTPMHGDS